MGSTLHHLVAKVACGMVRPDMMDLLAPCQLGFGMGGIEAAVHAARRYIHHPPPGHAVIKLAFNSVCRDKMLNSVQDFAPTIYPFVYSAYSAPSLSTGMIKFSSPGKEYSKGSQSIFKSSQVRHHLQ